jgi:hypothetical protein
MVLHRDACRVHPTQSPASYSTYSIDAMMHIEPDAYRGHFVHMQGGIEVSLAAERFR